MKRPLYYLLCAIACTSMVSAAMPMAAIAEAIQPQATANQQAQADATTSDAGKAGDDANTNTPTANTATSNNAATPTNTTQPDPADANTAGAMATPNTTAATSNTATPGTTAATDTPTPSLRAQAAGTPEAITTAAATAYAHSATASQNGVTFTVSWDDAPAGTATTFHVTQANGSSQAKARMDVPTYWDDDGQESVCDPSRQAWASYYSLGTAGHDFAFDFTASGTYRIHFYFMDNDRNDPQNDKGIYYLRTTAEVTVNDAARPSVTQIVNDAVDLCRQETNGSEYDMALWLHDWTLDQLEYDHGLNWCSAESGLTRHQGTCESYQRIYSKLLNAAGIANGRITGNGHTWNAVKIDGKWCQMDLTWDDTNDNWYGDLDQRHLYFGLTDELMAIAHSDHTANYQKDDYAYRSTDLSNNYFVRTGKADEWADKYVDRIQQHLDAKEESFSIDADNQSFPPSISGIQNGIVAYAINQREWSTVDGDVALTATSNIAPVSTYQWSAQFEFKVKYPETGPVHEIADGVYRIVSSGDPSMCLTPSSTKTVLSSHSSNLIIEAAQGSPYYTISTLTGFFLTANASNIVISAKCNSTSQLWSIKHTGGGYIIKSASSNLTLDDRWGSLSEESLVWLYEPNGSAAQAWDIVAPKSEIESGTYSIVSSVDDSFGIYAGNQVSLSQQKSELVISFNETTGTYAITNLEGDALTDAKEGLAFKEGTSSLSQEWSIEHRGSGFLVTNVATKRSIDNRCGFIKEGNEVWTYAPNASNAQLWKLEKRNVDSSEIEDQHFKFTTSLDATKSLSANQSPSLIISAVGSSFLFTRCSATGCYYVTCKGDYLTGAKNRAYMAGWNGSPNQLWEIRKAKDAYILINHATGQALDVQCGSKEEGTPVWSYNPNGSQAQLWNLTAA